MYVIQLNDISEKNASCRPTCKYHGDSTGPGVGNSLLPKKYCIRRQPADAAYSRDTEGKLLADSKHTAGEHRGIEYIYIYIWISLHVLIRTTRDSVCSGSIQSHCLIGPRRATSATFSLQGGVEEATSWKGQVDSCSLYSALPARQPSSPPPPRRPPPSSSTSASVAFTPIRNRSR